MFKPAIPLLVSADDLIEIVVNGVPLQVPRQHTLAAALLGSGVHTFRHTPVSGQPRGPLCMMGVCFECLVEVDGVPNQQACMLEVASGMRVRLQSGARHLEVAP
jgi:D-hydroxyproline dehydrogenase subunit gamma